MGRCFPLCALAGLVACGGAPATTATLAKVSTVDFEIASPHPPDVVFVVDRSAHMAEPVDGTSASRWGLSLQDMVGNGGLPAMMALGSRPDDPIRMGLVTASGASGSPTDLDAACAPGTLAVPVQSGSAPAIAQALSALSPGGEAPLTASLEVAASAFPQDANRQHFIVLLTDGLADCNGDVQVIANTCGGERCVADCDASSGLSNDPRGCLDDTGLVSEIASLERRGIHTVVLGFGAAPGSLAYQTLDLAAAAGGAARSGERQFFDGSSQADLAALLPGHLENTCTFALPGPPASPDAIEVGVTFCGQAQQTLNSDQFALEGANLSITDLALCQQLQDATPECPNRVQVSLLATDPHAG